MKDQEQKRQDLSQPSLEKLLENIPSKYELVIEATIRAKKIKKLADEGVIKLEKWQKPLTEALNDIAEGKIEREVTQDYESKIPDVFLEDEGVVSTFGSDESEVLDEEGVDTSELSAKFFEGTDIEESEVDEDSDEFEEHDRYDSLGLKPQWGDSELDIMEEADEDVISTELNPTFGLDILPTESDTIGEDFLSDVEDSSDTDALVDLFDEKDAVDDLDLDSFDLEDDDTDDSDKED